MKRRDTIDFPRCPEVLDDINEKSDFFPSHTRSRTLSQFSIALSRSSKIRPDLSKASPTSTVNIVTGSYNASRSPTMSACASLRSLAGPHVSREKISRSDRRHRGYSLTVATVGTVPSSPSSSASSEVSPISPSTSLSTKSSISSIRSSSHTCASDVQSSAPSSTVPSKTPSLRAEGQCTKLHPVLAACERRSKVSTRAVCATCMKPGYDYPKCAKCGEMWCSRGCRLRDGAKRHICSRMNS